MSNNSFKPTLGLTDATMIVAGSMIGSGIFIVSADIVRNTGSAGWLILVWLLTGFMTLIAALSYGELSAMFPKAGGQYVYLKEAYNPLIGFLYGWSFFAVIQTGTIAAVGVAFAKFLAYLVPELGNSYFLFQIGFLKIYSGQLVAIVIIILLTYVNSRGVKEGKWIQTLFTSAKLLALIGLIVFGFVLVKESYWDENWKTGFNSLQNKGIKDAHGLLQPADWIGISGSALMGAIAASMVGSIFSSDAWNNVTFIAGEIKDPKRNIPRSLFFGTLLVTVIYVLANIAYLSLLPLKGNPLATNVHDLGIQFATNDRVGAAAASVIFGDGGLYLMACLIMISTFGCNNGLILAGARVYYAMAKEKLFLSKAAEVNSKAVPSNALWYQCIWACALCLTGTYKDLVSYATFASVLFYIITIIGIFILRKKEPDAERPYKAFGYPVIPALYILAALAICIILVIYDGRNTGFGLVCVATGIPVYYLTVGRKK